MNVNATAANDDEKWAGLLFDCGLLDLLLLSTLKGTECTWRHWIEAGKIHISHLNIWISLMFVWMHSHCCRGIHDYFTLGWISPVSNEHNANVTMLRFINKHNSQCRTTKDYKSMKKEKLLCFEWRDYARGFGGRREGWIPDALDQTPRFKVANAWLERPLYESVSVTRSTSLEQQPHPLD